MSPLPYYTPGGTGGSYDRFAAEGIIVKKGDQLSKTKTATGNHRGDAWAGEETEYEATDGSWVQKSDIIKFIKAQAT